MGFVVVLMWVLGLAALALVLLFVIGSFSLETDRVKANRYLADLHDRDASR